MTEPKPEFWSQTQAAAFQHPQVAEAYQYRPMYPPETFAKLADLIIDTPRRVLDLGCGTGFLARHLIEIADRVDAVDISAAMIERGKQLPNGDSPKLHWLVGGAEEIALEPPYALVTAGNSLHWMNWNTLLPRIGTLLAPNARLAILGMDTLAPSWNKELEQLIRTYSMVKEWHANDLITELTSRTLFTVEGSYETAPALMQQSIDEYVESFHARSSLAHGRMEAEQSAAFDRELRQLLGEQNSFQVELQITAKITWGIPHAPRDQESKT